MLGIFMTGCQTSIVKPSVLDNPVCAPPCWEKITPGLTTRLDALNLIKIYKYLQKDSLRDYAAPWQGFNDLVVASFQLDTQTVTYLDIYFLNDKVAIISFQASWSLTLDQAINRLGKPTNIIVNQVQGQEYVELFSPTQGIAFGYIDSAPWWGNAKIGSDNTINQLDYFSPEGYQAMLDDRLLAYGSVETGDLSKKIEPWNGYGDLSQYEK
ncbi:MAG TPA: hypothetical protein VIN60_04885 [Anaerolineales bacterium]